MIVIAVLFVVLTLVSGGLVFGPQISDWVDDVLWALVVRREYRRISRSNPHLRPETLAQMTRRAWEEHQRSTV